MDKVFYTSTPVVNCRVWQHVPLWWIHIYIREVVGKHSPADVGLPIGTHWSRGVPLQSQPPAGPTLIKAHRWKQAELMDQTDS